MSAKVFTNFKTDPEKAGAHRPCLNSYKREYSMPDNFHIEVPSAKPGVFGQKVKTATQLKKSRQNCKTEDDEVLMHGSQSPPPPRLGGDRENGVADSLLSKHNGWITID